MTTTSPAPGFTPTIQQWTSARTDGVTRLERADGELQQALTTLSKMRGYARYSDIGWNLTEAYNQTRGGLAALEYVTGTKADPREAIHGKRDALGLQERLWVDSSNSDMLGAQLNRWEHAKYRLSPAVKAAITDQISLHRSSLADAIGALKQTS